MGAKRCDLGVGYTLLTLHFWARHLKLGVMSCKLSFKQRKVHVSYTSLTRTLASDDDAFHDGSCCALRMSKNSGRTVVQKQCTKGGGGAKWRPTFVPRFEPTDLSAGQVSYFDVRVTNN